MHDLPTTKSIIHFLNQPIDERLKRILRDRLALTLRRGLQDQTHIVVIEAGDTEQQIVDAIGFSPLQTRIDGVRNALDFDWLERHDGWWELLYTVGNSGFAYVLLVEDAEGSPLAGRCRRGWAG